MVEHITLQGLEKIKRELEDLETAGRKKVASKIKQAVSQGDISDSADYAEAKEAQAFLEGKIRKLKRTISSALIIDKRKSENVTVGSTVVVDIRGEKETFEIVGSAEADPLNGKISLSSPLGKALDGCKKNDTIEVETPSGKVQYKIVQVR